VLRLRVALERASRRRWLAVLIILLLVFVVAFVVGHDAEHAVGDAAAACLALAIVLTSVARLPTRPLLLWPRRAWSTRAPPLPPRWPCAEPRDLAGIPLRL
jgi:drug/metabolite transporter (DMT)-like permease